MIVYHIGIVVFMIYQVIELCLLLFNHDIQIQKIDPVEIHVHLRNELIANEQLSDYQTSPDYLHLFLDKWYKIDRNNQNEGWLCRNFNRIMIKTSID